MHVFIQLWFLGQPTEHVGVLGEGLSSSSPSLSCWEEGDSSSVPCCLPVARFGYCREWVWMELQKGQGWKTSLREGGLVLSGPVLQMPREVRDLPPRHPG